MLQSLEDTCAWILKSKKSCKVQNTAGNVFKQRSLLYAARSARHADSSNKNVTNEGSSILLEAFPRLPRLTEPGSVGGLLGWSNCWGVVHITVGSLRKNVKHFEAAVVVTWSELHSHNPTHSETSLVVRNGPNLLSSSENDQCCSHRC